MNWVGGARQRVKQKNERRIQKEFFERRRKAKKYEKVKPQSSEKSNDRNDISQDLLFLIPPNNKELSGFLPTSKRPVNFVDLSKPKKSRIQHNVRLDGSSPSTNPKSRIDFDSGIDSSFRSIQSGSTRFVDEKGETPLPREILEKHIAEAEKKISRSKNHQMLGDRTETNFFKNRATENNLQLQNQIFESSTILSSEKWEDGPQLLKNEDLFSKAATNKIKANQKRYFPQKPKATSKNDGNDQGPSDPKKTVSSNHLSSFQMFHSTPISKDAVSSQMYNDYNFKQANKDMLFGNIDKENALPREEGRNSIECSMKLPLADSVTQFVTSSEDFSNGKKFLSLSRFQTHAEQHSKSPIKREPNIDNSFMSGLQLLQKAASHDPAILKQPHLAFNSDIDDVHDINVYAHSHERVELDTTHLPGSSQKIDDTVPYGLLHVGTTSQSIERFDDHIMQERGFQRSFGINNEPNDIWSSHRSNRQHKGSADYSLTFANQKQRRPTSTTDISDTLLFESGSAVHLLGRKEFDQDQLCPKTYANELEQLQASGDDSEEDWFRQEMFKQRSAFNVSLQSQTGKQLKNNSFSAEDPISMNRDRAAERTLDDWGMKHYQLSMSEESDMPQSVPEALAEVLEIDANCSTETLSADESRIASVENDYGSGTDIDEEEAEEENVASIAQVPQNNESCFGDETFGNETTRGYKTCSESDKLSHANNQEAMLENMNKASCISPEYLSPCNKATQTNSSIPEDNPEQELEMLGSRNFIDYVENPKQLENSIAVQTETLFCQVCGCAVCDLLSDIAASQKEMANVGADLNDHDNSFAESNISLEASKPCSKTPGSDSLGEQACNENAGEKSLKTKDFGRSTTISGIERSTSSNIDDFPNIKYSENAKLIANEGLHLNGLKVEQESHRVTKTVCSPTKTGQAVELSGSSIGNESFVSSKLLDSAAIQNMAEDRLGKDVGNSAMRKESENHQNCNEMAGEVSVSDEMNRNVSIQGELQETSKSSFSPIGDEDGFGKVEKPSPLSPCVIQTRSKTAKRPTKNNM